MAILMALAGLAVAGLSIWWLYSQKPTYGVEIGTAAAEHRAYLSTDARLIDAIVDALNQAVQDRG